MRASKPWLSLFFACLLAVDIGWGTGFVCHANSAHLRHGLPGLGTDRSHVLSPDLAALTACEEEESEDLLRPGGELLPGPRAWGRGVGMPAIRCCEGRAATPHADHICMQI